MRMMATCRPEAFESCGVHPNQPVCPMKLAMCLVKVKASTPDKISTTCGASLDNLAQYAAVLRAAKPAPVEAARKEDAEREVSPVEVTDEMQMQTKPQHHHSKMACVMHRVIHFLTHQGTFFLAMIGGFFFAWICYFLFSLCVLVFHHGWRRNATEPPTSMVVTSEPYKTGYVTVEYNKVLSAVPVELGNSQMQV